MPKHFSIHRLLLAVHFFIFFWIWHIVVSLTTFLVWLLPVKQIKKLISKRGGKKISVLYLEVFSPQGAGNRYRTTKWVDLLNKEGFSAISRYVYEYNEYLELTSQPAGMAFFHMGFLWHRYWQCWLSLFYDVVIVRREILMFNDYGNLFFERFLSTLHPHLILDFDDNIAAAKREPRELSLYGKLLFEHSSKFTAALKYYNGFIPASSYLKQWLLEHKKGISENNILILPTCVDYEKYPSKSYDYINSELTIGWVGARNNLENVLIVIPALNALATKYRFRLVIVCDAPLVANTFFPVVNVYWNEKFEMENLRAIDIGIMPLITNDENKGKAGFKLIQYMGCGLVSLSTGLTVNTEIVDEGINGFLVPPDNNWEPYFEKVFNMRDSYATIGKKAFEKIEQHYSFKANTAALTGFLRNQVKS